MRNEYTLSGKCESMSTCDPKVCFPSNGKCLPVGAVAQHNNSEFILDTGSAIANFRHEYCQAHALSESSTTRTTSYASDSSVTVHPAQRGDDIFGVHVVPMCSTNAQFGEYNVLGIAPTSREENAPHSFMNAVGAGDRRFVVDKSNGRFCVGRECTAPEGELQTSNIGKSINGMPLLAVTEHSSEVVPGLILDTGSTTTWKRDSQWCVVGFNDINSLDVDYDSNVVRYDIDRASLATVCNVNAPNKYG